MYKIFVMLTLKPVVLWTILACIIHTTEWTFTLTPALYNSLRPVKNSCNRCLMPNCLQSRVFATAINWMQDSFDRNEGGMLSNDQKKRLSLCFLVWTPIWFTTSMSSKNPRIRMLWQFLYRGCCWQNNPSSKSYISPLPDFDSWSWLKTVLATSLMLKICFSDARNGTKYP